MAKPLTVGSLFAGIGGFDLAAERVGWEVKWQVEIDDYATRVLEKHWPAVRRYRDVRTVHRQKFGWPMHPLNDCPNCLEPVDVICGGFPCQDISVAGRGDGIDGARSGLWFHFDRLVGELRPRIVVVENVAALLTRGLGRVLGDLAARGYDAEWDCLPASAFGAPHRRDRVWIVAHASGERQGQPQREPWCGVPSVVADDGASEYVADTNGPGQCEQWRAFPIRAQLATAECRGWWGTEPNVGRVAHGVPARVDRLRGLGNAIVPQVAQWIFRQIQAHEESVTA